MKTKTRPRIGDTSWEVDYIHETTPDEYGDHNPDKDKHCFKHFATVEAAREWAKANFAKAVQGFMEIDQIEYMPYEEGDDIGYWQHVGETEYYEGES